MAELVQCSNDHEFERMSLIAAEVRIFHGNKVKAKVTPLQARCGPEGV